VALPLVLLLLVLLLLLVGRRHVLLQGRHCRVDTGGDALHLVLVVLLLGLGLGLCMRVGMGVHCLSGRRHLLVVVW
jgi:hypothetical protein